LQAKARSNRPVGRRAAKPAIAAAEHSAAPLAVRADSCRETSLEIRRTRQVNWNNPLIQLAVGLLAVAIALNVAWRLLQPVLPALLVLLVLVVAFRWWQSRW
jgi:hypothetical protein